jgi:DNA repair exonuclease SbcCD ATPase subunit
MAYYLAYLSHIWSGFANFFRRDPRKRGVTHEELENAFSDFLTRVTKSIKDGDLAGSDLSKERIKILQQEVTRQISRSQEYVCRVVAAHDVQLDEQNKNDRNSLRKEARDLREEFKAVKEARIPELQPYVKEVVESILSKLVPLEVEKSAPVAVKKAFEDLLQEKRPQLERDLEKNLVSIINKLEGVKGANIEQLVEKKKGEREKAMRWRRIKIWGLTAAAIGVLGYIGTGVYKSMTKRAEDAITDAGTAIIAVKDIRKQFEDYKKSTNSQFGDYAKQLSDEKSEMTKLEQRTKTETDTRAKGLEAQIAGLKTETTQNKGELDTLKQAYSSLKTEAEAGRNYSQALETNMQGLNKRIGELIAKHEEYVKGALTKEEFDKQITGIATGIESLKKEIEDNAELRQKYEDLRKVVEDLQKMQVRPDDWGLRELPEIELKLGY